VPSERLRRIALNVWIAVGAVALVFVLLWVAGSIRVIWLPIAFGAGLVFLLEPVVRAFERLRLPRPVAAVLALLTLVAFILAVVALVLPTIRQQAADLGERLPDLYLAGINWVRDVGASLGLDVDELLSQEAIEQWLNDPANQETVQSLLLGFGAGIVQDLLADSPLGLWALVFTAVAFFVVRVRDRLEDDFSLIGPFVFGVTAGGLALFAVLGTIFGEKTLADAGIIKKLLLPSLYNMLLAALILPFATWVLGAARRRSSPFQL